MTGDPAPAARANAAPTTGSTRPVFARPPAAATYGNEGRAVVQLPGINNWNLALFKNFPFGARRFQFRIEAYNVLNTLQFRNVDRAARFDRAAIRPTSTSEGEHRAESAHHAASFRFTF
jgi:hypothetical protein